MSDDSTMVITDIKSTLAQNEDQAQNLAACFLVIGGEINGTIFDLRPGAITIGRSADNEIILEFEGISRKHIKVYVKDQEGNTKVFVEDMKSLNGSFLNNQKLGPGQLELKKGDVIKVGSIALKYIPKGDPERLTYDKLNLEANTDGLTGCFNKMYFNNHLELEIKKSKVTGNPLALIILDLDHFKKLNDNFGHDAGDFTLKELAEIVRKEGVRDGDIFARYGGEEFVIILPKTSLKHAVEIAERIRVLIQDYDFNYDGKKLPVTSSVGVADYQVSINSAQDLFKRVDSALYQSKNSGRNKVTFYKE